MAKRSTTQRGYGAAHQAARRRWTPRVKAGGVICPRCNQPIVHDPDQPGGGWDLGHNEDRTGYNGPEHANDCNRSAGGRNGAMVTNSKRSMTIYEW